MFPFHTVSDLVVTGDNISAQVGDSIILFCNVSSIPPGPGTTIIYQWRRVDMSPVSASFVFAMNTPLFENVNVSHAGEYICEVTVSDPTNVNVIPQNSSVTITLTVTSK